MIRKLLFVVVLAGVAASVALATPTRSFSSIALVDKTWRCTGPVNLDSVSVNITTSAPVMDAVLLDKGCTGRIGSLVITEYRGDALKIGSASNLTVESAVIRCFAHATGKHQDGIQITGGSHIRLVGFDVGCYSANNSQVWMNPAGVGKSNGANNVVFVGGHFQGFFGTGQYGKAAATASPTSIRRTQG